MALTATVARRNAMLAALVQNGFVLSLRSGTRPVSPDIASSDTETLATVPASFSAPSGGSIAMVVPHSAVTAIRTGTATWFRLHTNESGAPGYVDGAVSATGGGGDLQLNSTSVVTGQSVTISGLTITLTF